MFVAVATAIMLESELTGASASCHGMSAVLALTSAVVFGAADFLGGVATKRAPVLQVTAISQLAGGVLLACALLLLPGTPTGVDLAWGAASGLAGGSALLLFYAALAKGTMSIVSPITAAISAIVPFGVGLALGERPALWAVAGVGCALVAVVLVSMEPGELTAEGTRGRVRRPQPGPLMVAMGAGLGFGLFFVLLAQSGDEAGLWPLLGARGGSLTLYAVVGLSGRAQLGVPRAALGTAVAAGAFDMTANALYLLAVSGGLLSLIAVLASLYPVSTILLARAFLSERLAGVQWAGVAAALAAVALIS